MPDVDLNGCWKLLPTSNKKQNTLTWIGFINLKHKSWCCRHLFCIEWCYMCQKYAYYENMFSETGLQILWVFCRCTFWWPKPTSREGSRGLLGGNPIRWLQQVDPTFPPRHSTVLPNHLTWEGPITKQGKRQNRLHGWGSNWVSGVVVVGS